MIHANGSPELHARLTAFVARVQRETGVPGIGVAIDVGGQRSTAFAGKRALGQPEPFGDDTRLHLGCLTKLLLAIVALELEQQRALDTDGPVCAYLPELRGTEVGRLVRVRHLLSHTSGYRGTQFVDAGRQLRSWDDLMAYLRRTPLLFTPGAVFSYEHTEALLLAEIVRRTVGRASLELVAELLERLGIPADNGAAAYRSHAGHHRFDARARCFVELEQAPVIASLWRPAFADTALTLGQLLTIAAAASGVRKLLAPATLHALATSSVTLPETVGGPLCELLPVGFGRGTAEFRDGLRGNTGIAAGQCVGLRFEPRSQLAIAVALNAMAPHLRDSILAAVCREFQQGVAPRPAASFAFDFAALCGTYLGPGAGVVTVRRLGERLLCEIGREHRSESLRVELSLDADRRLVATSATPFLSLGFFATPQGEIGMALGLSAYRRMDAGGRVA